MFVQFATCERNLALKYIQQVYPNRIITDTPDCAGPLLDYVEKDIVRVQDQTMYGNQIQIVPGKNWVEDETERQKIIAACGLFHLQPTKQNEVQK